MRHSNVSALPHRYGMNGKQCLLRAICDANLYEFGALNGVLGDLVHIMFSWVYSQRMTTSMCWIAINWIRYFVWMCRPTTSKDENLPKAYYVAEARGRNGESCEKAYGTKCPNGIFDLITIIKWYQKLCFVLLFFGQRITRRRLINLVFPERFSCMTTASCRIADVNRWRVCYAEFIVWILKSRRNKIEA